MSKPKLTARTGDTLAAVARLSGSENHKGYDIIHADGYAVAYVIPIDEDGVEGEKLARQFAAAPELLEALERAERALQGIATAQRFDRDKFSDDSAYVDWARSLSLHVAEIARAALAKARGGKECWCQWDAGDSPCPTHGMDEEKGGRDA